MTKRYFGNNYPHCNRDGEAARQRNYSLQDGSTRVGLTAEGKAYKYTFFFLCVFFVLFALQFAYMFDSSNVEGNLTFMGMLIGNVLAMIYTYLRWQELR